MRDKLREKIWTVFVCFLFYFYVTVNLNTGFDRFSEL